MTSYLTQHDQHTVQVQRFATKLYQTDVFPSLEEAYKAAARILSEHDELTSLTQVNRIAAQIRRATKDTLTPAYAIATQEMGEFAIYEASFYAGLITATQAVPAALSVPADEKILNYINRALMSLTSGQRVTAGLWGDLVKQNIDSVAATYDNIVKSAFANGQTIREAKKALLESTNGFIARDAESLVRTGIQHYATQARLVMADDNKDVIAREIPIVTFDNRTSTRCMGIDSQYGKKGWPAGESPIGYAPYHHGCRTTIAFLVEGEDGLEGRRAAVGGKSGEDAKEAYEKRKDRKRTAGKVKRRGRKDDNFFDPSQVNAKTQYEDFFLRQPIWWQESALGPTRAKLVRDGKFPLNKFNDMTGRKLSLDELRAIDAEAFRRAGL